ncbi:MAG: AAA family ATPase, partial [Pseudonocardia sp.]|nr:AAA family ATPase [Pseudonocardia sp.]
SSTVASSKLTPPALPRDFVTRAALRATLDAGAESALALVCAPPGFGKSLLLADWIQRSPDVPAAWVSLGPEDVDPRRLWTGVLAALQACAGVPPASRLHRLVVSRTTVELEFLYDLMQAVAQLPQPIRLVLDDAHHLRRGPVVDHLRMLVRDTGPRLRLVLASRTDPLLPLAKMRLDDGLCELRVDRMRFALADSLTLLGRSGLRLAPGQYVRLHEKTGGWVAGLRLATRSLQDHADPDGFLEDFCGDDRSVADYLTGEVLAGMSDDRREVLRRTSIADPIPPALAVELCDREDAAEILDGLARDLGLVITLTVADRTEYRIQELLRSYLLADLHRQGADQAAALHRRAARWWDRHGRPVEALRHIGRTGDTAVIGDLLRRRAPELVAKGEHGALLDALAPVADAPELAAWPPTLAAQAHLERGDRAAVAAEIRRARQSGGTAAELLTALGRLAGLADQPPRAEPLPEDPALAVLALAGRGATWIAAGSPGNGRADLTAALDGARRQGLPLLEAQCLTLLGGAAWARGDLSEAASLAAAASTALCDGGWRTTGWAASARAVAALAALDRAEPEMALDTANAGLEAAQAHLDPAIRFALRAARGGALSDSGRGSAALLELQQARAEVGPLAVPLPLAARAALLEHRIALGLGCRGAAASAAAWLGGRAGAHDERLLMRAWAASAAGALPSAFLTLAPLREPSARPAWPGTVVEAWLTTSWAALAQGDRPTARRALRSALDRAMPLDAVRPFGVAPSGVRALLVDELVSGDERSRFVVRALALNPRGAAPTAAVLTAREHEVMARLPSLLNFDEIAVDLAVSSNTVKSHVRSIYQKLGAGTRRTAVLAAHDVGILR